MELVLILLGIVNIVLGYQLYQALQRGREEEKREWDNHIDRLSDQLDFRFTELAKDAQVREGKLELQLTDRLVSQQANIQEEMQDLRAEVRTSLAQNREQTEQGMRRLQESNEARLEAMRQTVEEKLETTLQSRLRTSFETVSQQLESVNKGLGEMRTVAQDVGNLNKVLSGSKSRGILGEIQLGQILEDMLAPHQYEREFALVPESRNRVEYAIKFPGPSGQEVYLPIDAKFPLESFYRLEEAFDQGDKEAVAQARKDLLRAVKGFARDIKTKYIAPPRTTDFGILFLPTEALYAELVRDPLFLDQLRKEEQVVLAGPSTLAALLNSLAVGFKTLHLQRNAEDISQVLAAVKKEFQNFGRVLDKTQEQLRTASGSLDQLIGVRSRAIERSLRQIELEEELDLANLLSWTEEGKHEN
ncbi:DNA recombination protein RmuC [Streptococcus sp. NLN76]|uniref:DNA recombination protein RmuC n=1 Tax=Streptococcus sp. NLN76 TaxID=2822800 RepID=UPI0018AC476D|nr:DNA recombination protein RmuC [Streptococcus sp. NLN76]MBF8970687.1 DNA recombination protein RmuC [Streptococcus sp. NLN76]